MNNLTLFEHYLLMWDFGTHHEIVETNLECFNRVVDEMSKEFEISRSESFSAVISRTGDYIPIFQVEYSFLNYYGDKVVLGLTTKSK